MAHFSSRVEVKGDPTLAAQLQSDMNMGMGMNMNMNMGMPNANMRLDAGDARMKVKVGDTKMKVDMGIPDISFHASLYTINKKQFTISTKAIAYICAESDVQPTY